MYIPFDTFINYLYNVSCFTFAAWKRYQHILSVEIWTFNFNTCKIMFVTCEWTSLRFIRSMIVFCFHAKIHMSLKYRTNFMIKVFIYKHVKHCCLLSIRLRRSVTYGENICFPTSQVWITLKFAVFNDDFTSMNSSVRTVPAVFRNQNHRVGFLYCPLTISLNFKIILNENLQTDESSKTKYSTRSESSGRISLHSSYYVSDMYSDNTVIP